jgi:type II secretory pathway predicted ATPase ExeA
VLAAVSDGEVAGIDAQFRAEPAPTQAFAADTAGAAYFASDAHHRVLVAGIRRQHSEARGFVIVTGEPGAKGELLTRFLDDQGQPGYRATLVRCQPGMRFSELVQDYGRQLGLAVNDASDTLWALFSHVMLEVRAGTTRVLVIENADVLDVQVLVDLCRFTKLDHPHLMPVVLLAAPSFATQLHCPPLDVLKPVLVAVQHLEREEVKAFIDRQLDGDPGADRAFFPPETVDAIATAANGNPVVVNRLARLVLSKAGRRATEPVTPARPSAGISSAGAISNDPKTVELSRTDKVVTDLRALRREANAKRGSRSVTAPVSAVRRFWSRLRPTARGVMAALCLSLAVLSGATVLHRYTFGVAQDPPTPAASSAPTPLSVAQTTPSDADDKGDVTNLREAPAPDQAAPAPSAESPSTDRMSQPAATSKVDAAPALLPGIRSEAATPPAEARQTQGGVAPSLSVPVARAFLLHMGSLRTPEGAEKEWERLKRQQEDLLGTLGYKLERVDLGERGVFYRILAGPISDGADAERNCAELKRRRQVCILVKP